MLDYERKYFNKNNKLIAGIDEVGRGPLAGPLVVAAIILDLSKVFPLYEPGQTTRVVNKNNFYSQIRDSKKISANKRSCISELLINECIDYSIIEIGNHKIDELGIANATDLAFYESIKKLKIKPNHIFTDTFNISKITKDSQTNITRGDQKSITIAAASIVAKVYRDNLMVNYHNQNKRHQIYGFNKHKGYGTKQHLEAIKNHGYCDFHRKSFEPIKSMINERT